MTAKLPDAGIQNLMFGEMHHRFCIIRHEELPEGHKESYRSKGIDPDTNWSLIYSFKNIHDASKTLLDQQQNAAEWQTYLLIDAGHCPNCIKSEAA